MSAETLRGHDGSRKRLLRVAEGRGCGSGISGCCARHIQRIGRCRLLEFFGEYDDSIIVNMYVDLKQVPGSPEYAMRRCGLSVLILSSSIFILTIERAEVVSAATIT